MPNYSIAVLSLLFILPSTLAESRNINYFKEYMSRGLYACTSEYVQIINEIQKLSQRSEALHEKCDKQMKEKGKNFPKTNFAPFDELMEEWQGEKAKEKLQNLGSERSLSNTI